MKYRILNSANNQLQSIDMKVLTHFNIFLICLLQVTIFPLVWAQNTELRFEHLTIENGLSQNRINCILQDSKGFMWIGTNEGLNKYDGYEFFIFEKGSGGSDKLSDDFIQCIYEDQFGNILIGTGSDGLNIYNRTTNHFTHCTSDSLLGAQISSKDIRGIIEDKNGILWIATPTCIEMIDRQNNTVFNYVPDHLKLPTSSYINIASFMIDANNNLWIGTGGAGLCFFNTDTKTFKYFQHDPNDRTSISDNDVRSLYTDSDGNFWVGTHNGGFNLFDTENNVFRKFLPDPKTPESLTVRAILDEGKESLWIGTRNGIYKFNKRTHQFIHSAHDLYNPYSLSQNNIQVIFRDSKGDFWFGTKNGINFLNTSNMLFSHYRADDRNREGLNQNFVTDIYEDSYGDLWFGTSERGLNRLDKKSGRFTYFTHNPNNPASLGSNNVNSIIEDKSGGYWIGTFQGGLNYYDRKSNRFIRHKLRSDAPLVFQPSIESLYLDQYGDIWVSAVDYGLQRFDRNKQVFTPFELNDPGPDQVVRRMIEYGEGKILAGGNNRRIFIIDIISSNCQTLKIPTNNANTLVIDLVSDDEGNIWIATSGSGLLFYDIHRDTFEAYTQKDGLSNNFVKRILKDELGNLWLSTIYGLSKFNPGDKIFKNYYKENGLISNQFNAAAYKTKSGEFLFGSIKGAISFFPEKIVEHTYTPPIVLTNFTIFNKPVNIGGENPILNQNINDAVEINLTYDQAVFTLTYAALDFTASELNQYAYIMEGFETDWNYVGNRRFATYTNLNPGEYKFKIKGTNSHGIWNEEGKSINIIISPPFWNTWWFKLIIVGIILFIAWHIFDYFKQKRDLLKATSLANLTQLKLLRNQMNPHFLLNTFSAIRALVLIDKKQAWQSISELSDYFRYVLLNYNKIEASLDDEIEAVKNYINIQRLLIDSLKISFNSDEATCKCIVPAFLFQPLIENAIKHGHETSPSDVKIIVNLSYVDGILSIDVSNTGKLVEPAKTNTKVDKAHGTSIKNIKKRLDLMFKDLYTFRLFEADGMVHAKIEIKYDEKMSQKQALEEFADIDQ
jgi:ligand-binding sensor domain-containing protein